MLSVIGIFYVDELGNFTAPPTVQVSVVVRQSCLTSTFSFNLNYIGITNRVKSPQVLFSIHKLSFRFVNLYK